MKMTFKRAQSLLLAIAVLTSMGFTTLASGETQITQDNSILYSDDFSTGYTVDDTALKLLSPDYTDVKIGGTDSNWYLTKGINTPPVASTTAQFMTSTSNYFRTISTNTTGYYASNNYKGTPYLAYKGTEYSNLNDNYKIKAKIQDNAAASAIRFMIDSTKDNYYELYFAGIFDHYTGNNNLWTYTSNPTGALWIFDKYVNGARVSTSHCESSEIFTSAFGTSTTDLGQLHSFDVEITVINNSITWKLTNVRRYAKSTSQVNVADISSSWTDPNPFPYKSSEAKMGLVAFTEQKIDLKSFSFENIDNFVGMASEPSNIIYKNVTKEPVDGVMTFDSPCAVRKIVNSGDDLVTVLLSENNVTYYKLADVPAGASYVNNLTYKKYKYVKAEGGDTADLSVFTDSFALSSGSDAVAIEARINDADVANPTITSSDNNKVYCEDKKIYPLRAGGTVLTVSDGINSLTLPVNVTDAVILDESFSGAETTAVSAIKGDSPYSVNITDDGKWIFSNTGISADSTIPVSEANMTGDNLTITATSVRLGAMTNQNMPFVLYNGSYSQLSNNYELSFDFNKNKVTTDATVRFMINGNSYYSLSLNGYVASQNNDYHVWTFAKVVNGNVVPASIVYGEECEDDSYAGSNGGLKLNCSISIKVNNGNISWTIVGKRYAGGTDVNYSGSGSYNDNDCFAFDAANAKIGFACGGYYDGNGISSNNITVDNLKLKSDSSSSPILFVRDGTDLKVFFDTTDTIGSNVTPIVAAYNQEGSNTVLDDVWTLTPDENNFSTQTVSDYDASKRCSAFVWNMNDITPYIAKLTY